MNVVRDGLEPLWHWVVTVRMGRTVLGELFRRAKEGGVGCPLISRSV